MECVALISTVRTTRYKEVQSTPSSTDEKKYSYKRAQRDDLKHEKALHRVRLEEEELYQ